MSVLGSEPKFMRIKKNVLSKYSKQGQLGLSHTVQMLFLKDKIHYGLLSNHINEFCGVILK